MQPKYLQISKLTDTNWNRAYTKSNKNSVVNEMVNWFTSFIWKGTRTDIGLDRNIKMLTCKLVGAEVKNFKVRQFDDVRRNRTYTKSSQNSVIKVMVELVHHLFNRGKKKYWPVNLFHERSSLSKFVNLTISEGILPEERQVKTASCTKWWTILFDRAILLQCDFMKIKKC